jgi:hypothetical protein
LFEGCPERFSFLPVLFLQAGDLGGEGQDEVALAAGAGGCCDGGPVFLAEALDAVAEGGMAVEEGV